MRYGGWDRPEPLACTAVQRCCISTVSPTTASLVSCPTVLANSYSWIARSFGLNAFLLRDYLFRIPRHVRGPSRRAVPGLSSVSAPYRLRDAVNMLCPRRTSLHLSDLTAHMLACELRATWLTAVHA